MVDHGKHGATRERRHFNRLETIEMMRHAVFDKQRQIMALRGKLTDDVSNVDGYSGTTVVERDA
jgi:hypothetical protein